jgi:hypothetical protein
MPKETIEAWCDVTTTREGFVARLYDYGTHWRSNGQNYRQLEDGVRERIWMARMAPERSSGTLAVDTTPPPVAKV